MGIILMPLQHLWLVGIHFNQCGQFITTMNMLNKACKGCCYLVQVSKLYIKQANNDLSFNSFFNLRSTQALAA